MHPKKLQKNKIRSNKDRKFSEGIRRTAIQIINHKQKGANKTLERLVALLFIPYLEQMGLLPPIQPGFRAHHSTETALPSLLSQIYIYTMSQNKLHKLFQ